MPRIRTLKSCDPGCFSLAAYAARDRETTRERALILSLAARVIHGYETAVSISLTCGEQVIRVSLVDRMGEGIYPSEETERVLVMARYFHGFIYARVEVWRAALAEALHPPVQVTDVDLTRLMGPERKAA